MKRLALRLLQSCGVFSLARAMSAKRARILMYHNFSSPSELNAGAVSEIAARSQFDYLRRHFRVVSLTTLVAQLNSGMPLERHTVALTIDDGRRNCYESLFPLLKEFRMSATFFVVSSFIRGEDWIWTDKVLWLGEQPAPPRELATDRIDDFFGVLNRMRPERRNACIRRLAEHMGVSIPTIAPQKYAPCSWGELREMADSGLVEIGSHSVSHPVLASLTDEESWQELTISRAHIEEGLGRKIRSFCYPNGRAIDYRPSQIQQVKKAGYASAVATHYGMPVHGTDPYDLPRIGVSGRSDDLSFSKYLDGVEYYQAQLQASLGLRGAPL